MSRIELTDKEKQVWEDSSIKRYIEGESGSDVEKFNEQLKHILLKDEIRTEKFKKFVKQKIKESDVFNLA